MKSGKNPDFFFTKNKQMSYIPHGQKLKTSPLRLGKRRYLLSVLQLKILLMDIATVAK